MTLNWTKDGPTWPLHAHSRFVAAGGLTWHVQELGQGPPLLLLHGTAASTHSWRDVAHLLAADHMLIIPDLPGHAFTRGRPPGGLTLPGVARALAALLAALDVRPVLAATHSAGTAIACRMALDGVLTGPIVGFGPALLPMGGSAAPLFSGVARLLFLNPFAPHLFAGIARQPGRIGRFMERATGAPLSEESVALYGRLLADPGHLGGAIEMMARWDLVPLERDLPRLPVPLVVVQGGKDSAIRPADARRAATLARARYEVLADLGHLAHEQRPDLAAALIRQAAAGGP